MGSAAMTRLTVYMRPRSHAGVTAACILATVALSWRYVASPQR